MEKSEYHKIALGYASMLTLAIWQAVRAEGEKADPERMARVEVALASGEVSLGVYICRTGDNLRITSSVIPTGLGNPLPDPRFTSEGPMIFSQAQLDALKAINVPDEPRTLN